MMDLNPDHVRNYFGGPDNRKYVVGPPKVIGPGPDISCPNCGCLDMKHIEVRLEGLTLLKGGKGIGYYVGCPACPFASPMIAVADGVSYTPPKEQP